MALFADDEVQAFREGQAAEVARLRELPADEARVELRRLVAAEARWLAARQRTVRAQRAASTGLGRLAW